MLTLVYEDLVSTPVEGIRHVLEALGANVDVDIAALLKTSRFQKFTPTDLSLVLANYEPLRAALEGTVYEPMLLDKNV